MDIFGIDYGTYTSSICCFHDKPIPIKLSNGEYLLRSFIHNSRIRSPKRDLDLENKDAIKNSVILLKLLREATKKDRISAVVTIPVAYNSSQREATKLACELAGIDIIRLISEPTAIALNLDLENCIIVDIGGGTTDISLVEYDKETHFYEVIKNVGDSRLGGEDVNNLLYDYFQIKQPYEEVYQKLELIKKTFSGSPIIFDEYQITKEEFTNCLKPFYKRIAELLSQIIQKDVPIILAGGSSNLFGLKEYLYSLFPNYVIKQTESPEFLVSSGACLYAHSLQRNTITLIDISSLSIGISDYNNNFVPIIPKGSVLPISVNKVFTLSEDNDSVTIKIYQGERKFATDNKFISSIDIKFDKFLRKNEPRIDVKFTLDHNNILHVNVSEKHTGTNVTMNVTKEKIVLSPEEVQKILEETELYKQMDEEKQKEAVLLNKIYDMITLIEINGFECSEIKEKIKNVSSQELKNMIQDLAEKYPFSLVSNTVIPSNSINQNEIELDQEQKELIWDRIEHIRRISSENEDTLRFIEEQLQEENIDFFQLKMLLDNISMDKKNEYETLVKTLQDNLDIFQISDEDKKRLLEFIDSQKGDNYEYLINELNDFCGKIDQVE